MRRLPVALILLVAAGSAISGTPDQPKKSCTDPVPADCTKVQFLGQENDCSCFVCNPGTKSRKVVCTNDDAAKKALNKLREDAPGAASSGATR